MRYQELTETTRNLGGFTVKVVANVPGAAEHDEVDEAFQNDEANLYYRYDPSDGRVKQRMVSNHEEKAAFAQGYKDTPEQALRAHGIIRSKFDPKKFVQKQGDKWIPVFPFGKDVNEALDLDQLRAAAGSTVDPQPEVEKFLAKQRELKHRIGLTVTDPNHPMVSKRGETYQKTVRVNGPDKEKAINSAIAHYRRKGYKVHDHHYMGTYDDEPVAEGKKKSDTYHIVNKDGKPANLASYADKESAVKDRDAKHPGAEVRQVGPRGKVKGVAEGSELKQAKRKYNQAAKDANYDQVGAGKKIDTMKKSLRQKDLAKQGVAEGLGYSTDPEQGKWYHEGRKAYKYGTTSPNGLIQGIAKKHGCPPEWLDAFLAGYQEQEGFSKRGEVDEAIKIDAPQKAWSKQDMQDYLTRIKTGTKTKQDRFKPIIHGSNVKAITKDDGGEEWDLDDLARQITTPPRAILGTNAKMAKSKEEGSITYDLTLPALSGIVVDEETGEFVEITTCPGAGECQLYCYARKGGYVMFPASSMSAAQALNFLVNHPAEYMKMFDAEVKKATALAKKNGIKLLVRVHDAGDFFSKEYYDLVMGVKEQNPDCKFYFYTKMGAIASADQPDDVIGQFSPGAKSREVKTVQVQRDAGKHVKDAVTLPKDMFRELFVTDAKGKYVKDAKGRTQVKSAEDWQQFKQKLAAQYKLDPDTIITYDEMNRIPEGPKPKWNVVVFPAGHGDLGASRLDVSKQFLMFH